MASMAEPATKKKTLHALVDALPEGEVAAAERYLAFLAEYAEYAEPADDSMNAEQRVELRATLKRGIAAARAGESRPVDEFLAEFNEP